MFAGITALISSLAYLLFPNKRSKIVKLALTEVGKNNKTKFWLDTLGYDNDKDWCGSFILWVYHQIGIAKDWKWEVGKGFIYKLPTTLNPKPGDVAYFTHNQHQAIVESVNNDIINIINGNGYGNIVTRSQTTRQNVTAFYSIEKLLT